MKLPKGAIDEYRELIKQEFGHDMTDEEARESAESFMRLVLLILEPQLSERTRRLVVSCKCGHPIQ